jgi:hypothetical protein
MQDALNSIMDLCESKMNENDYLIVTVELKKIYEESKKKAKNNRRIVGAFRILNQTELQMMNANSRVTFALTDEEQKSIMDSRWKQYYEQKELSIRENIDDVVLQLRETSKEKKDAWTYVKQWRYSNSVNRENSLYEHRVLVQREKVLKLKLKELRKELLEFSK